jgi:uncharacterized protein (TIGR02217 family)
MPFFECEFPRAIAYSAQGGPTWSTIVNRGFSGYEQRNRNWLLALSKWKIALDYKPISYFQNVYDFWLNVGGMADAFRFLDRKDFEAFGQPMLATSEAAVWQLARTYVTGTRSYVKPIQKPITSSVAQYKGGYCEDTVVVYLSGVEQSSGWTLDYTTGLVTFTSAPSGTPTADFQFHHPARFDMDDCQAVIEESDVPGGNAVITWADVTLIEVRL